MISKAFLINVFETFDFPSEMIDEFLVPIAKKDILNFSDFCLLFKSKRFSSDLFFKSFATGFLTVGAKENRSVFPVNIYDKYN
jgi:hypothetical protein